MEYCVRRALAPPPLEGEWGSPDWERAETLEIRHFRPESSGHRPVTRASVLHDASGLYVLFEVQDRYVRCLTTEYQGRVYEDACVEFFARPKWDKGYFNFEMNCGGVLLLKYIEDPTRTPEGFAKFFDVPWRVASQIEVYHSLATPLDPETVEAVSWRVAYRVPFSVFEEYVGPLGEVAGQEWRGNFYKCAENNSHPHWAAWSPIAGALNFHQPDQFGCLRFED